LGFSLLLLSDIPPTAAPKPVAERTGRGLIHRKEIGQSPPAGAGNELRKRPFIEHMQKSLKCITQCALQGAHRSDATSVLSAETLNEIEFFFSRANHSADSDLLGGKREPDTAVASFTMWFCDMP
jgi:hypothetical protein